MTTDYNGQMTAAVLYGREDVKIEQVAIPRIADDEVLVRVEVALTCEDSGPSRTLARPV